MNMHGRARADEDGRTDGRTTECVFRRLFRCDRSAASPVMRPIESGRAGEGEGDQKKEGDEWMVGWTHWQTDR